MTSVFQAIFYQVVLDYSPAQAGLLTLAINIPLVLTYTYSGKLYERYGPRVSLSRGAFLNAAGLIWVAITAYFQNYYYMVPGLILIGFSIPLITVPSITTSMSSVPAEQRGIASGVINLARQLSSSFSLAILTIIVTSVNAFALVNSINKNTHLSQKIADGDLGNSLTQAQHLQHLVAKLSPSELTQVKEMAGHAYTKAYSVSLVVTAIIMLFAFFMIQHLLEKKVNT